jgi:hypothetical protein
MTEKRQPPKLGHEAPGLVWRPRQNGWAATWQARSDIVKRGYLPKTVPLWTGSEPSELDAQQIAMRCATLQSEMLMFARGVEPISPNAFAGTLRTLINAYQTDKDSPYQKNRYHVRRSRDNMLRRISAKHGREQLSDIKARILLAWHQDWSAGGTKVAAGAAFIGQLRTLFSFGATLLEDSDCERLCGVLHKMRFPGTKPRGVRVTADYAGSVCDMARDNFGWPSMALAQAFQFECTLRQKDVIGEWVPLSEPGISAIARDGEKWLRGITWQEVDENLILRHITSKKQKETEVDLKLAPMVLKELQMEIGDEPLIVVDEVTKKVTVNRHLLPASGAIIISEITGYPWSANEYRRKWRKVANACGIPKDVFNMDSRSGAISEGILAGAQGEWVQQAATHSDIKQTMDYTRIQAEATAKVMRLRMENRNKPKAD